MKRVLLFFLTLCFFFAACACEETSKVGKPIEEKIVEFEEKYKRADFDAFIADPSEFINDYIQTNAEHRDPGEAYSISSDWEQESEDTSYSSNSSREYRKNGLLFNKSVRFSFSANCYSSYLSLSYSPIFMTGSAETDFLIARALTEKAFELFGEATSVEINDEDYTEYDLRRMFESESLESFKVRFSRFTVYFFYFENQAGSSVSFTMLL